MVRLAGIAVPDNGKISCLDHCADSFRRDHCLRKLGIEQKRGKFLAAETCRRIAASHYADDARADLLESSAAGEVAVFVIDVLEMVHVHHQDAEPAVLCLCPAGLAAKLGKERAA